MGNVRSLRNALDYIGEESVVTSQPADIFAASRIILPGVGAFGDAMRNLRQRGLIEPLQHAVNDLRKPFLGICLGLQLLARHSSEHGLHGGLGWFDAEVCRFDWNGGGFKVPHMGWNTVLAETWHPLFAKLGWDEMDFYFVHSYHIICRNPGDIAGTCDYGYRFPAAICRDNIFAAQFHPEKSQDNGIQFLTNFAQWNP